MPFYPIRTLTAEKTFTADIDAACDGGSGDEGHSGGQLTIGRGGLLEGDHGVCQYFSRQSGQPAFSFSG
jgi:hypothetical protein